MSIEFRPATPRDTAAIMALEAAYYASENYAFEAGAAGRAIDELLADPARGRLWVADDAGVVVAYLVVAFSHSLEYQGRDAFIDELYVAPSHRGGGIGRTALSPAEDACKAAGVRMLHLEVERDNATARQLYRRVGFVDHDRILMSKRIA